MAIVTYLFFQDSILGWTLHGIGQKVVGRWYFLEGQGVSFSENRVEFLRWQICSLGRCSPNLILIDPISQSILNSWFSLFGWCNFAYYVVFPQQYLETLIYSGYDMLNGLFLILLRCERVCFLAAVSKNITISYFKKSESYKYQLGSFNLINYIVAKLVLINILFSIII